MSLKDFAPAVFDVNITVQYTPDNVREKTVRMGMLSWHEWNTVAADIVDPLPPFTKPDGKGGLLPNPSDERYRRECAKKDLERDYRRLVVSLERGENIFDSTTEAGKIEEIKGMDAALVDAMLRMLNIMKRKGQARIEQRADNFHAAGDFEDQGDESGGDQDAGGMVGAA